MNSWKSQPLDSLPGHEVLYSLFCDAQSSSRRVSSVRRSQISAIYIFSCVCTEWSLFNLTLSVDSRIDLNNNLLVTG